MLNSIDKFLGMLPGNGSKTKRGILVFTISLVVNYFATSLPVVPSTDAITMAVDQLLQAIDLISAAFELLGLGTLLVGLFHKVVKFFTRQ